MKHFLTILLLAVATLVQAQNSNEKEMIEAILQDTNTCFYQTPTLHAINKITIENHTNDQSAFGVIGYTDSEQWSVLSATPNLLSHKEAYNNGFISHKNNLDRYTDPAYLMDRAGFKSPIRAIAINASSLKPYSIKVLESGQNMILQIYDLGEGNLEPVDIDGINTQMAADTAVPQVQEQYASFILSPSEDNRIYRMGNKYKYQSVVYDKSSIRPVLYDLSRAAYNQYTSGYKLANAGCGLLIPGALLDIIGIALLGAGESPKSKTPASSQGAKTVAGAVMTSIGGLLTGIGIPCICFGYNKMHTAAELYNVKVEAKEEIKLSLTTSGNGAGLALAW